MLKSVMAAMFVLAQKWKQSKCLSAEGGLNRLEQHVNMKKYCTALKKNMKGFYSLLWKNDNLDYKMKKARYNKAYTIC